ncbi:MAG: flagellar basal body P-ring formation protein FlgA [Alphaproteobacteria bacterium]|nr:flagellar basal body P-ring formation protein FlgA [Alphaproteobacteria bacterium]
MLKQIALLVILASSSPKAALAALLGDGLSPAEINSAEDARNSEISAEAPMPNSQEAQQLDDQRVAPETATTPKVVATRSLQAGDIIADGDLAPADGYGVPSEDFYGLQVRRNIYQGSIVNRLALQEPIMVRRNAIVEMLYRRGELIIKTEGRALDEGATGERVRVMNIESRQTVTAFVIGAGQVEVGG